MRVASPLTDWGQVIVRRTTLGGRLERLYRLSGHVSMRDFCEVAGISYYWFRDCLGRPEEPQWMRSLRAFKRATGATWDEILGG